MELHAVAIFFRWLHVVSACVLLGSVYFFVFLLPAGTRGLEALASETLLIRCRRGLKMTVHVTFLLFLISGIYNAIKAWPIYTRYPGVIHGIFGLHVLLALGGLIVLMIMLAGRHGGVPRVRWARWALALLVLAIGASSTLKAAREWATVHPPARSTHGMLPRSAGV